MRTDPIDVSSILPEAGDNSDNVAQRGGAMNCSLHGSMLALAALLAALPVRAASDCSSQPFAIDESRLTLGPRHHPVGRPLPATAAFHQPDGCVDGLWFFDENRNGTPDAAEVRVFGANRQVDCGSCHGESPSAKSPASASVFLRQDATALCQVCHDL